MALTALQRDDCRLLAADRRAHGESYVAGGVALGVALETARISRDLDLFHDTLDAVARSWDRDGRTLAAAGYAVDDGPPPDAHALNRRWHHVLDHAEAVVSRLPSSEVGRAVLTRDAELFTGDVDALERALAHHDLLFHEGRIGGAFPRVR